MFLDSGDCTETVCDLGESFLLGNLGRFCILFHTFHSFLLGSNLQVVYSLADNAGINADRVCLASPFVEEFQEYLGVMKLIGCCLVQYVGILIVEFFLRCLGEECVTCVGA